MDEKMLKINILLIAGSGVLMLISGIFLFMFRGSIPSHLRFFLPIPPLGVAAYVFVFNVFKHFNGEFPENRWEIVYDVLWGTALSAIVFGVFTALLVVGINCLKKIV